MIKKGLLAVGAATVCGLLLFGTDLWSYATTFSGRAHRHVKRHVPLEFEIERARTIVADLVPDIRQNMHTIAEEEVDLTWFVPETLEAGVAGTMGHLAKMSAPLAKAAVERAVGSWVLPQQWEWVCDLDFEVAYIDERSDGIEVTAQTSEGFLALFALNW